MSDSVDFSSISKSDYDFLFFISESVLEVLCEELGKSLDELYLIDCYHLVDLKKKVAQAKEREIEPPSWDAYKEMVCEVKEFIFLAEDADLRAEKCRPPKDDFTQDYIYLQDLFEMLVDFFKHCFAGLLMKQGFVFPLQVQWQMIFDLAREENKTSLDKFDEKSLMEEHLDFLEVHCMRLQNFHGRLSSQQQAYARAIDLLDLIMWGDMEIYLSCSIDPYVFKRYDWKQFGSKETQYKIRRPWYEESMQGNPVESEVVFLEYLYCINEFLIAARSSFEMGKQRALYAALYYYLLKLKKIAPVALDKQQKTINRIFRIFYA